jgi:hypothetical protein
MKKNIVLFGFFFLGFTARIQAQIPFGVEFQLNTETSFDKLNPVIALLQNGDFIGCWECYDSYGNKGIHGQIFSGEGIKKGEEFIIDPLVDFEEHFPGILPLSNGNYLITWSSINSEKTESDLLGQIFNVDGQPAGSVFQINPSRIRGLWILSPAKQLLGGNLVFSWGNGEWRALDSSDVYLRLFNQNGVPIGDEIRANTYTIGYQVLPQIAPLSGGGFNAFWLSNDQGGSGYDIYSQLFNPNGGRINEEFRVNAEIRYPPILLVPLSRGGFVLCWTNAAEFGSYTAFFAQVFGGDGKRIGNEITVAVSSENIGGGLNCAALEGGGFVVVWSFFEEFKYIYYGRIFSAEGEEKYGPFRIPGGYDPFYGVDIVPLSKGGFFIYGRGDFLYGQFFNQIGETDHNIFKLNDGSVGIQYKSVKLSKDDFLIAWLDGSEKTVRAKRFPESPLHHELSDFHLLTPSNDATVAKTETAAAWEQPSNKYVCYPWELHYRILIDETPNFTSPEVMEQDMDTTFTFNNLQPGMTYFWKVLAKNIEGDSLWSTNTNAFFVSYDTTGIIEEKNPNQQIRFILHQNFPNPFNTETAIRFDLPESGFIAISIYDISGKLVRILTHESRTAGSYSAKWDGKDPTGNPAPSGIYICRMEIRSASGERFVQSVKMGLVR